MRYLILAILTFFISTPIWAHVPRCAATWAIAKDLLKRYGEHRVIAGLSNDSTHQIVIYENPKSGTGSVFRQYPNGQSCVIGAGRDGLLRLPAPSRGKGT